MSWARTGLDPITMAASAHASEALERIATPFRSFRPRKTEGALAFGNGQAYRKGLPRTMPSKHARGLMASSAGTTAAACAGSRRRHPGLARSWPGRTRVRVAYVKPELSVVLKSAKDL